MKALFRKTALVAATCVGLAACAAEPAGETTDDLTSATALARDMQFGGTVYVSASAGTEEILSAVRVQSKSAFGALRTAFTGANSREFKDVDTKTFVKTPVTVIDTSKVGDVGIKMLKVSYTFSDTALVPKTMAKRSSLSLGLLGSGYSSQTTRVLKECTDNDHEANEFVGSIWYVFNPSLSQCKKAMATEQKLIDADRKKLKDAKTQVSLSESKRLYVPMTLRLTGNKTNKGMSWPEYDRLYAGGVKKDRIVISMVNGMMADWAAGEKHDTIDDDGYPMWHEGLREILKGHKWQLVKTDPPTDLSTFTVGTVTVKGLTFDQLNKMELENTGWPAGITTFEQKKALRVAVADKVLRRWLTFEAKVSVKKGTAAAKTVTLQLDTYFGAESDATPHKRAIKTSDVFIYNGHSYIGYGPLDPKNFSAADFPTSYQILFINGCVSYNYYEKDYLPLKKDGTKNLELITNGLESWVNGSGPAMGRFVATLLNGKQANYMDLLKSAQFTGYGYAWGQDALRVVDGELDNLYAPTKTPLKVTDL